MAVCWLTASRHATPTVVADGSFTGASAARKKEQSWREVKAIPRQGAYREAGDAGEWFRCIVSFPLDIAHIKMESWVLPTAGVDLFLQGVAKRHIEVEHELLDRRKLRREERLGIYKLFTKRCWKGLGTVDATLCGECHLERQVTSLTNLGPLVGWMPQVVHGLSPAQCFAQADARITRCLYAVQQVHSEELFTPEPDEYDYAD